MTVIGKSKSELEYEKFTTDSEGNSAVNVKAEVTGQDTTNELLESINDKVATSNKQDTSNSLLESIDDKDFATETTQESVLESVDDLEVKQDNIIEQISPATELEGGGKISVGTTPVEITFAITTKTIILTADQSNNDIIYWGGENVDSNGNNAMGYLEANNVQEIHFDDTDNKIYVVAKSGTQNIWKGALS